MRHILTIENDDHATVLLRSRLAGAVKIKSVPRMETAWEKLRTRKFDLILWDATCNTAARSDFQQTLRTLSARTSGVKTIVFTDVEDFDASEFSDENIHFQKYPISDEALLALITDSLPYESCGHRIHCDQDEPAVSTEFEGIVGISLPMRAVIRRVLDVAEVDIPVLVTGETGTGKDLIAAAIHKRSQRKYKPYIALNTGAMAPELIASEIFGHERGAYTGAQESRPGIFEQADGGTVFLDEIATMDEKTQISLLRVLEEKMFRRVGGLKNISADVRIIAATNEHLEKSVAEKRFREDLFYRLNVFPIAVPPLRDRPGAVTVLTDHFVAKFAAVYGKEVKRVLPETYRLLRHYSWPGNVRELKNAIQTAVLMAETAELTPDLIPTRIRDASVRGNHPGDFTCAFSVGVTLDAVEKELIRVTLAAANGNKKQAASTLGISRRALYNKILRHRLS
jgi:two-component system NtrC family response regulator